MLEYLIGPPEPSVQVELDQKPKPDVDPAVIAASSVIEADAGMLIVPTCPLLQMEAGTQTMDPDDNVRIPGIPSTVAGAAIGFSFILTALTVIIVYGLSRFHRGTETTSAQRGFVLSWMIIGNIYAIFWVFMEVFVNRGSSKLCDYWFCLLIPVAVYITPAVGGIIVTGLQMKAFGDCERIGGLSL